MNIRDLDEKKHIVLMWYYKAKIKNFRSIYQFWITQFRKDFTYEDKHLKVVKDKLVNPDTNEVCVAETQFFNELLEWCKFESQNRNFKSLKELRLKYRNTQKIDADVKRLAIYNGYDIQKGSAKLHPYHLSGFRVVDQDGNVVCGNDFEMSRKDVRKYFESLKY